MIEPLPPPPNEPPWREFARAPLVPAALGAAAGLALDRVSSVPFEASLIAALVAILVSCFASTRIGIPLAFAALAAAHHQAERNFYEPDDIGNFAAVEPRIVKIRGFLEEEPTLRKADHSELFGPARRVDRAVTTLRVSELSLDERWQPVSGLMRVSVERVIPAGDEGTLDSLDIGDEIEAIGLLSKPSTPGNPGERDYASFLLDRRIRAELRIVKDAKGVTRLAAGGWSWNRLLADLRARFTTVLKETTPANDVPLARALLPGDTAAAGRDDWDVFARTGVIHVLAISGQHLVILAGVVWLVLRTLGLPRRWGAWLVLALIVIYAALTGGRPSAIRAAVMVSIVCGGIIARRPVHLANSFALAWLVVVVINPMDAVSPGSLLSFLSVFTLIWGVGRWLEPVERSPVEQLLHESRPAWLNALRAVLRWLLVLYAINLALTFANAPLIISAQNVAPPVGILIGPPVILLTTVALLSGFTQLLVGLVNPLAALPFGLITALCLSWSKSLVVLADQLPYSSLYLPDLPVWWMLGFHAFLIATVLFASRRLALALMLWTLLGLLTSGTHISNELRVTFLSVGHGGCTVLETPDGRVIVYDAGTMAGPDTVKRVIAPFLWSRGIRRIDELILSHADLDHYNGVPELLRRFPVGQATMTPSFAEKPAREVAEVMLAFEKHGVPRRVAVAGESFRAGEVTIDVLHPPPGGFAGSENERSLVLLVSHRKHTLLLTGDLEKNGTAMLLATPPRMIDVLMAPHHGSPAAFPDSLAKWASPKLVVVSRGPRSGNIMQENWSTWEHGAVTVTSHATGVVAETFRTKERRVIVRGE